MSWENKELRTFSDELKRNAVQRAEAGAHPFTQISRELGIHPSLLQVWRQSGPVESQENGKRSLRKALYFPAVVASRHNRALRQFAERLRSRDKSNMLIIVARNVKSWKSNALLQPEARAAYARLLAGGWTDAIRTLNPREPSYTFWHYL